MSFDFAEYLKRAMDGAAFVSVASVVLAGLASVVGGRLAFRGKVSPLPAENANLEEMARIDEVREALGRQESIARWMTFTNGLLIFGQVVIGGVLASAFIQDQLPKSMIGLLGLLVLLSSLIYQQVRPDIKQRGARRRAVQLRELLRYTEDGVFNLQRKIPGSRSIEALRHSVTASLSKIERGEVEELPGEQQIAPSRQSSATPTVPAAIGPSSADASAPPTL